MSKPPTPIVEIDGNYWRADLILGITIEGRDIQFHFLGAESLTFNYNTKREALEALEEAAREWRDALNKAAPCEQTYATTTHEQAQP